MPPDEGAPLRSATSDDAAAIAALHTRSWRATYRGSFSDAYLDGPIEAERDSFWRARLSSPTADLVTLLFEEADGTLAGFVCGLVGHDPRWGTLVDNLHVAPRLKGRGHGRLLMRSFAQTLVARRSPAPVHLFVLTSNIPARDFYLRIGGTPVERVSNVEPDGSTLPLDRIAWSGAQALVDGTG